jgi:glycine cleavage system aminomethyltransferase T
MNLDFLTPATDGNGIARSPMEHQIRAAGVRFAQRDGWELATEHPSGSSTARATVGWIDTSHLRKLELQGEGTALETLADARLPFGTAIRIDGAWWCRLTDTRALVLDGSAPIAGDGVDVVDVSSTYAALTVVGPLARETLARFSALDLRPQVTPVGALRPGSVGRQPSTLIREGEERYLFLFGWATAEYMWSVVADAGEHLGGHALGVDQLADFPLAANEEQTDA